MNQPPVIEGEFPTGPELMLWRPGLHRHKLRWRLILRSALRTIIAAAVGVGFALLPTQNGPTTLAWIVIVSTAVIAGFSALSTVIDFCCAEYDHQHPAGKPCALERAPGKFFYRASDFHDLPAPMVDTARRLLDATRRVHASPATAWLNAQQLRDLHRVAWDALCIVDRTRTLREVLADPRCAESDEHAAARSYLSEVDDAVDRVLTCLLQAELLVTSWERKLDEIDLRAQLRTELNRTPREEIAATTHRAEEIPESIFAYITAARDLTGAGPFAWERS